MSRSIAKKIVSGMLVITFVMTPVYGMEVGSQIAASIEILASPALTVPSHLASIDRFYQADRNDTAPTIIHILDAHEQPDAQKSIRELLHYLQETEKIGTLFLEGGFEELDPKQLQFLENAKLNEEVLEQLEDQGVVGGVERFFGDLLSSPSNRIPSVIGIEDPEIYKENMVRYLPLLANKAKASETLNQYFMQLDTEASKELTADQLRVFRQRIKILRGNYRLDSLLGSLNREVQQILKIDLTKPKYQFDWPQLVRYYNLQKMENSELDQNNLKKEEDLLGEFLSNLDLYDRYEALFQKGLNIDRTSSTNVVNSRRLVEDLYQDSVRHSFSIQNYPHFSKKLGFRILQEEIQGRALFEEVRALSDQLMETMNSTEQTEKLIQKAENLYWLEKLIKLELTPDLYPEILMDRLSHFVKHNTGLDKSFRLASEFYEIVLKRDEIMFKKLYSKLSDKDEYVVLITGGFHAPGIQKRFEKKGLSYYQLSPKMDRVAEDSVYENLFGAKSSYMRAYTPMNSPDEISGSLGEAYMDRYESRIQRVIDSVREGVQKRGGLQGILRRAASLWGGRAPRRSGYRPVNTTAVTELLEEREMPSGVTIASPDGSATLMDQGNAMGSANDYEIVLSDGSVLNPVNEVDAVRFNASDEVQIAYADRLAVPEALPFELIRAGNRVEFTFARHAIPQNAYNPAQLANAERVEGSDDAQPYFWQPASTIPDFVEINGVFLPLEIMEIEPTGMEDPATAVRNYRISLEIPSVEEKRVLAGDGQDQMTFYSVHEDGKSLLTNRYTINAYGGTLGYVTSSQNDIDGPQLTILNDSGRSSSYGVPDWVDANIPAVDVVFARFGNTVVITGDSDIYYAFNFSRGAQRYPIGIQVTLDEHPSTYAVGAQVDVGIQIHDNIDNPILSVIQKVDIYLEREGGNLELVSHGVPTNTYGIQDGRFTWDTSSMMPGNYRVVIRTYTFRYGYLGKIDVLSEDLFIGKDSASEGSQDISFNQALKGPFEMKAAAGDEAYTITTPEGNQLSRDEHGVNKITYATDSGELQTDSVATPYWMSSFVREGGPVYLDFARPLIVEGDTNPLIRNQLDVVYKEGQAYRVAPHSRIPDVIQVNGETLPLRIRRITSLESFVGVEGYKYQVTFEIPEGVLRYDGTDEIRFLSVYEDEGTVFEQTLRISPDGRRLLKVEGDSVSILEAGHPGVSISISNEFRELGKLENVLFTPDSRGLILIGEQEIEVLPFDEANPPAEAELDVTVSQELIRFDRSDEVSLEVDPLVLSSTDSIVRVNRIERQGLTSRFNLQGESLSFDYEYRDGYLYWDASAVPEGDYAVWVDVLSFSPEGEFLGYATYSIPVQVGEATSPSDEPLPLVAPIDEIFSTADVEGAEVLITLAKAIEEATGEFVTFDSFEILDEEITEMEGRFVGGPTARMKLSLGGEDYAIHVSARIQRDSLGQIREVIYELRFMPHQEHPETWPGLEIAPHRLEVSYLVSGGEARLRGLFFSDRNASARSNNETQFHYRNEDQSFVSEKLNEFIRRGVHYPIEYSDPFGVRLLRNVFGNSISVETDIRLPFSEDFRAGAVGVAVLDLSFSGDERTYRVQVNSQAQFTPGSLEPLRSQVVENRLVFQMLGSERVGEIYYRELNGEELQIQFILPSGETLWIYGHASETKELYLKAFFESLFQMGSDEEIRRSLFEGARANFEAGIEVARKLSPDPSVEIPAFDSGLWRTHFGGNNAGWRRLEQLELDEGESLLHITFEISTELVLNGRPSILRIRVDPRGWFDRVVSVTFELPNEPETSVGVWVGAYDGRLYLPSENIYSFLLRHKDVTQYSQVLFYDSLNNLSGADQLWAGLQPRVREMWEEMTTEQDQKIWRFSYANGIFVDPIWVIGNVPLSLLEVAATATQELLRDLEPSVRERLEAFADSKFIQHIISPTFMLPQMEMVGGFLGDNTLGVTWTRFANFYQGVVVSRFIGNAGTEDAAVINELHYQDLLTMTHTVVHENVHVVDNFGFDDSLRDRLYSRYDVVQPIYEGRYAGTSDVEWYAEVSTWYQDGGDPWRVEPPVENYAYTRARLQEMDPETAELVSTIYAHQTADAAHPSLSPDLPGPDALDRLLEQALINVGYTNVTVEVEAVEPAEDGDAQLTGTLMLEAEGLPRTEAWFRITERTSGAEVGHTLEITGENGSIELFKGFVPVPREDGRFGANWVFQLQAGFVSTTDIFTLDTDFERVGVLGDALVNQIFFRTHVNSPGTTFGPEAPIVEGPIDVLPADELDSEDTVAETVEETPEPVLVTSAPVVLTVSPVSSTPMEQANVPTPVPLAATASPEIVSSPEISTKVPASFDRDVQFSQEPVGLNEGGGVTRTLFDALKEILPDEKLKLEDGKIHLNDDILEIQLVDEKNKTMTFKVNGQVFEVLDFLYPSEENKEKLRERLLEAIGLDDKTEGEEEETGTETTLLDDVFSKPTVLLDALDNEIGTSADEVDDVVLAGMTPAALLLLGKRSKRTKNQEGDLVLRAESRILTSVLFTNAIFSEDYVGEVGQDRLAPYVPGFEEPKAPQLSDNAEAVLDSLRGEMGPDVHVVIHLSEELLANAVSRDGDLLLEPLFDFVDLFVGENQAGRHHIHFTFDDDGVAETVEERWRDYLKNRYARFTDPLRLLSSRVHFTSAEDFEAWQVSGGRVAWVGRQADYKGIADVNMEAVYADQTPVGGIVGFEEDPTYLRATLLKTANMLLRDQVSDSGLIRSQTGFLLHQNGSDFDQWGEVLDSLLAHRNVAVSA